MTFGEVKGKEARKMFDRIENIFIDYENGIFLVNGKKPECSVRLTIKEADG